MRASSWLALVLLSGIAQAQSESEHAAHHPAGAASQPAASQPAMSDDKHGEDSEEEERARPRRPIFIPPSSQTKGIDPTVALGELDAAARDARLTPNDNPQAQAAMITRVRSAISHLEEAWSSRVGPADPNLRQQAWFRERTRTTMAPPSRLTLVHLVSMAALAGLVLAGTVSRLRRRHRVRALLATPTPPVLTTTAPLPAKGWSGQLQIAAIFTETPAIRTFRFVMPGGGSIPFVFRAGQYVRVAAKVGDATVSRAYSISSAPGQRDFIELSIKREPDGKMSGFFHDNVKVGDVVEIAGPSGVFVFDGSRECLLLIGGGVGLTPLMSVVRDLTSRAWPGRLLVISSIARAEEKLFGAELELLAARHPNLTVITHVAPPDQPSTWIDRAFLERVVPDPFQWRAHVCGPAPMMTAMTGFLREIGLPADQILTEAFSAPRSAPSEGTSEARQVRFSTSARTTVTRGSATVLDAADACGVHIDASCRVGICGACKVKLVNGRVAMAVDEALTDIDRANGVVLACQAIPQTDVEVKA